MHNLKQEIERIEKELLLVGFDYIYSNNFLCEDFDSMALLEVEKTEDLPHFYITLIKLHKDYKPLSEILLNRIKK